MQRLSSSPHGGATHSSVFFDGGFSASSFDFRPGINGNHGLLMSLLSRNIVTRATKLQFPRGSMGAMKITDRSYAGAWEP